MASWPGSCWPCAILAGQGEAGECPGYMKSGGGRAMGDVNGGNHCTGVKFRMRGAGSRPSRQKAKPVCGQGSSLASCPTSPG